MEAVTTEKLDALMRKVHGLLAKADDAACTPPEAEAFRAKAEALMFRYRIDEAMLAQAAPAGAELKPEWKDWVVCGALSEWATHYQHIARDVMNHVGVRGVFKQGLRDVYDEDGRIIDKARMYYCEAVGYESELRMAEGLYTAAQMAFSGRLEPKYDPALSDQVNAYNMRSAGMEGWRIAMAIYGRDDKALRPKVRAMFKAEAIKRGEDPSVLLGKGNSVKAFREDFALGFVFTLADRLRQMRNARNEMEQAGLVLASRNEAVNEAFYAVYPQYRPVDAPIRSTVGYVDPRKGCAKCDKAKSGYCRDHSYLKPRVHRSGRETNWTAYDRGGDAARAADLGRQPGGTKLTNTEPRGELS
jgi:hypothetical protein